MERITIKHVNIKSFRNLKDAFFDAFENYTIIRGNNMKGKTNILNAIMWCLCGVDLEGSNDDFANIPFDKRFNGDEVVDVNVSLSVGDIRRVVDFKDKKTTERLFINGERQDVKAGDMLIDKMLGLLELSLKDTSSFKIRRFFLNPLYYESIAPSAFRQWVLKFACGGTDEKGVLKSCYLPEKVKNIIASGITVYGSVSKFSSAIATEIKKAKEELGHLDYAKNVLHVEVDDHIKNTNLIKFNAEENAVAIKEFANYLNVQYLQHINNSCLRIQLIEQGREEGTFNDCCYPVMISGSSAKLGSTAEKIFTSAAMVSSFAEFANVPHLPMLIDEGETIDSVLLTIINRDIYSQKFITSVKFDLDEHLSIDGK